MSGKKLEDQKQAVFYFLNPMFLRSEVEDFNIFKAHEV